MKKIIILIPVFNDWKSLAKLLNDISNTIKNIDNFEFNCIVINDSSTIEKTQISKPLKIKSLKIINMKINRGHARCNAFGIKHIIANELFNYVIC